MNSFSQINPVVDSEVVDAIFKKIVKKKQFKKYGIIAIIASIVLAPLSVIFGLFGLLSIVFLVAGIACIVEGVRYSKIISLTEASFPTPDALWDELSNAYYVNGKFLCTPKLYVFPGGYIVLREKIMWIYAIRRITNGILSTYEVAIWTRDCEGYKINIGSSADEKIFQDMMIKTACTNSPDLILGFTKEAKARYDEYERQYKFKKYNNIK